MINDPEFLEAVRTTWDICSSTYDAIPGHRIGTPEERDAWDRELGRYLPSGRAKVLDVGCGTAAMGLVLARAGHHVTGIDLSAKMIDRARESAQDKGISIGLISGDAGRLPFGNGSFDVIVTRHLLWTIPDPAIVLDEWYRVLVPGGRVLIIDGVWNDGAPGTRIRVGIGSWLSRIFDPGATHPASYGGEVKDRLPHGGGVPAKVVIDYLLKAGFIDIEERDLRYIRKLQRSQLSWYQRLMQGKTYYLVAGTKPGVKFDRNPG